MITAQRARRLAVLLLVIGGVALASAPSTLASTFDYQRTSLTNSVFQALYARLAGTGPLRAGSGSGTDACATNNWIPLGAYTVLWHDDHYAGSLIQGRVWRLTDYHCQNGNTRTELFVHSEETSSQGQYCPTPYDDPFCWEGASDYYSNGCIKLARIPTPSDLGKVDNFVHSQWGPATDLWVHT